METAASRRERCVQVRGTPRPFCQTLRLAAMALALILCAASPGQAHAAPDYDGCRSIFMATTCEYTGNTWPPPQPLVFWAACFVCDDSPDAGPLCDTRNEITVDQQSVDKLAIEVKSTWEAVPGNFTLLSETCDDKELLSFDGVLEPDTLYLLSWNAIVISEFAYHTTKSDGGAPQEDSGAPKRDRGGGSEEEDSGAAKSDSGAGGGAAEPTESSSCAAAGGPDTWRGSALTAWGLLLCLVLWRRRS